MKPKVYIETSVISYLVAGISNNLIIAANQQLTQEWWDSRRSNFDLFVSQVVTKEASIGDTKIARLRLEVLQNLQSLELSEDAAALAEDLINHGPIPEKAGEDALHIAIATTNDMNYLLTWNFKHMANATMRSQIERYCRSQGYEPVIICTPQELLEE